MSDPRLDAVAGAIAGAAEVRWFGYASDPDEQRDNQLVAFATAALGVIRRTPIPMRLPCPECGALHIDEGEFATHPHHTHACQFCGMVWRPAIEFTVGVQFLPGFKNAHP